MLQEQIKKMLIDPHSNQMIEEAMLVIPDTAHLLKVLEWVQLAMELEIQAIQAQGWVLHQVLEQAMEIALVNHQVQIANLQVDMEGKVVLEWVQLMVHP